MDTWARDLRAFAAALFVSCAMLGAAPAAALPPVKWHPGHYVTLLEDRSAAYVAEVLQEIADVPALRGIQVRYTWAELEPERGRYDFSRIERDLSLAQAKQKRLFLLLQPKTFDPRRPAIPDYIVNDGGTYEYGLMRGNGPANRNVALWNDQVRDRLAALFNALGQRFDREPYFEGVALTETAPGRARITITPEMQDHLFRNVIELNKSLRSAFPSTVSVQFVNVPLRVLPWLVPGLRDARAGLGGPDIFLEDPDLVNGIFRYYPQLAGAVPLAPSVQREDYETLRHHGRKSEVPIDRLYRFARDDLHANYLFWTRVTAGPNPYRRVLSYLRDSGLANDRVGGLSTTCPTTFGACDTR